MRRLSEYICCLVAAGMAASCGGQTDRSVQEEESTAVAQSALTGPASVTIPLPSGASLQTTALGVSSSALKLNDRVQLLTGLGDAELSNAGTGRTTFGTDVISRNVVSIGQVELRDRARIVGNLTTSVVPLISPNGARVTGATTIKTLTPLQTIKWTTTIPATSGGNVIIGPGQTMAVAPGRYSTVTVNDNAQLTLSSGTYYFDNFNVLAAGSKIAISGPVVIYTQGTVAYRGQITFGGAGTPPFMIVHLGTSQATIESVFRGHFVAPNARLIVGASGKEHTGSFFAKDLEVYPDVKIRHQPLTVDFDSDGLSFADEVAIYGTDPFVADTDNDGLNDGDEVLYWKSRTDGVSWNSDLEARNSATGQPGDGRVNLLDPDSDNDGLLDGLEVAGWNMVVNGSASAPTTLHVTADPAKSDTDGDRLTDRVEHDGWTIDVLGASRFVQAHPQQVDTDGDTLGDFAEKERYRSDPSSTATFGGHYPDLQRALYRDKVGGATVLDPPCPMADGAMENIYMIDFQEQFLLSPQPSANYISELNVYLPENKKGESFKIFISSESTPGVPNPADSFTNVTLTVPNGTSTVFNPGPVFGSVTIPVTPSANEFGTYIITASFNVSDLSYYHAYALFDSDGTRVPLAWEDGPAKVKLKIEFLTDGTSPAYLRGATYGGYLNSTASYVEHVKVDGKLLYEKSFNGGELDFPLGNLTAGVTHVLEMDWNHSGAPAKQWTHICQHGANWNHSVQIAYDASLHTKQYEGRWQTGIPSGPALVRRGSSFFVIVENSQLNTTTSPTFSFSKSGSTTGSWSPTLENNYVDEVSGAHRQTWRVTVPPDTTAGAWTLNVTAPDGTAIGTAPLIALFNPYLLHADGLLTLDELRAYAYDEDEAVRDSAGRDQKGYWYSWAASGTTWQLDTLKNKVSSLALNAIDGAMTEYQGASFIRQLANSYVTGDWTGPTVYGDVGLSVASDMANVTDAEALSRVVSPAHRVPGECFDFAGISEALYRSAGLASRLVYADSPFIPLGLNDDFVCNSGESGEPSSSRWSFHVWDEVYMRNPPTGTDPWYVFDATDCAGAEFGSSASRHDYGVKWQPTSAVAEKASTTLEQVDVFAAYQ